ncbi:MAG: 50S ribosomal protein L6 [Bacteroidia bacterium]|nr:50S ribosomal protein L6 [Bacteroidales bacterium]NCD41626.1 50S ribosomal protein L6 [Bacteroidia bacterium]MDD2322803.1 50S ribosomal protein L6 [Bacteroidales bacterium]MDD3010339.1 50S ribosomal protein L6 [Bacteroidales bacterium]MDD3960552.1 50S ribosomal protein L6 [Bacteroidales bacterium]
MSRIGKLPISVPAGVQVSVSDTNLVTVKGKLGELTQQVDPSITMKLDDGTLTVERSTDEKDHRAMHGLYRALIHNMIVGVSEGYTIKQEFVGVGYKATVTDQLLEMSLGYSHNIFFQLPPEIKAEAVTERGKNPVLTLTSYDKQLLGQVAAKIRAIRKPEPYKGKGIKFVGEELRKKAGKSAEK